MVGRNDPEVRPVTIFVKPGDDIAWTGTITRTGVSNFTGYTLESQIRLKNASTGALSSDVAASAVIAWVDSVAGVFSYSVPRATTASWQAGACYVLDIKVIDTGGKHVRTETAEFQTEPAVTA